MRILFLTHAFNSLAQRLYVELTADGHDVTIEFDINDAVTEEAVALARPELIVAPFLKRRIPESVWRKHRCIVIHPGIVGDRGPSALDWAIVDGEAAWGVTALEANADMDAGDIWASVEFPMRDASKSSLYRNEVTEAAVVALRETLERLARGEAPLPLAAAGPAARGRLRPLMRQPDRAIDWHADDYGHRAAQDPRGRRLAGRAGRGARSERVPVRRARRKAGCARNSRGRNPAA